MIYSCVQYEDFQEDSTHTVQIRSLFLLPRFLFWSTQGISSLEYDEYRYAFDVEFLNDQTPDKLSTDFGRGEDSVGAGVGLGFDLHSSYARNLGFCALTAFAWHLLVLWTLKTKDHRKHR